MFTDSVNGNIVFDGLIIMCMMILISKPETIINVRDLEMQLDKITLWLGVKNDVRVLTSKSKMSNLFQEIHAKSFTDSYTHRCFIINLVFRACILYIPLLPKSLRLMSIA